MKKFIALLIALFAATSVFSSSVNSGAIVIRVVDMNDNFVEGAEVSVINVNGAIVAKSSTNEAGLVGFYNLIPGAYTIRVEYSPVPTAIVQIPVFINPGSEVLSKVIEIPVSI